MNTQKPSDIAITDLLPQRPPFLMIDRLTEFSPEAASAELEVRADNIFAEDGRLSAPGLIENVAQTCAARIGYINRLDNKTVKLGFIGAIRNFRAFRLPDAGERLSTTVTVREEMFGMTLVDASIRSGDETIAECEMKIALSEIDAQQEGGATA